MSVPQGLTDPDDRRRLAGVPFRLAGLALAAPVGRQVWHALTPWPPQDAQLGRGVVGSLLLLIFIVLATRGRLGSRFEYWGLLAYSGLVTLAGVYFLALGACADGLCYGLCGAAALALLWLGRARVAAS